MTDRAPLPAIFQSVIDARPEGDRARAEALFLEAMTHRTYANERPGITDDNQRLELLGDAVLELIVTEALFAQLPSADEGLLSRARAVVVNEGALALGARTLGIGASMRLGRGELTTGGRERARTLADALEAVVAAAYLVGGLPAASSIVEAALGPAILAAVHDATLDAPQPSGIDARVKDAKSILQEILQRDGGPPPSYQHEDPTGPVHERTFRARVIVAGRELAIGEGRTRREAEMRAAASALTTLEGEGEEKEEQNEKT